MRLFKSTAFVGAALAVTASAGAQTLLGSTTHNGNTYSTELRIGGEDVGLRRGGEPHLRLGMERHLELQ